MGLQWLNPLQRLDYPTEWQLLWTLGLAKPNRNDDMVRTDPRGFSTLQAVAPIAHDLDGTETFKGYHYKYVRKLTSLFHDIYYSSPTYFYRVYPKDQKQNWRELAGIRVEYALPVGKLDPEEARNTTRERITDTFSIGNVNFPTLWTRATPPDVRITLGGNNAGFISLQAALAYLEAHPQETVWVMNWDAPSRPKTMQINENLVLLVLAGPDYKTERAALAWIGYPATKSAADFELAKDKPPRAVQAWQAWQAVFAEAARRGGKSVLVAGTSDPASVTGVLVSPPATVRPIAHDKPWFRARGENNAYLPWWGIRHDAADNMQGYSK